MGAKVLYLVAFALMDLFEFGYSQEAYQKKALELHNKFRAKHHVPALEMDDKLNDVAVKCAQYYANKGKIDHTCPHRAKMGENLFAGTGQGDQDQIAEKSVKMWYDEGKMYDYSKSYAPKFGHFTQVLWKGTQKLGFGYAKNVLSVAVAIYSPPGNYPGRYKENVLKP